jgi:PPOX class probable F420-dependent enzyme
VDEADPLSRLLDPAIAAFLRDGRVGRLATADAAGRPLVVPVCFVLEGPAVYSAVDAKPKRTRRLQRLANIAENPHVSLVVDHYEEDWQALRYVIVTGVAEILTGGSEFTRAIDLLVEKYPQYRALGLDREEGTLIKIRVRGARHWQYRAGPPGAQ